MIEAERKKEEQRDQHLRKCTDELERMELENKFGIERAEAQRSIKLTMNRHKDEMTKTSV